MRCGKGRMAVEGGEQEGSGHPDQGKGGQILNSIPDAGSPNLASQRCATNFGGAVPSSSIQAIARY